MKGKKDKVIFSEVQLNWLSGTRGMLRAKNAEGILFVGAAPAFDGDSITWNPEQFFLSAISSSYMCTFLAYAKKEGLEISDFECDVIGQIETENRIYLFTEINLFPKIYIPHEESRTLAAKVADTTNKHCVIAHSINGRLFYHNEILIKKF